MQISTEQRRQAFACWLRTGRLPVVRSEDGTELKFNPYHDPFNGRFTFAPGGRARQRERVAHVAAAREAALSKTAEARMEDAPSLGVERTPLAASEMLDASTSRANLAGAPRSSRFGRGGNARAFEDPMTLEQVFPGLQRAHAGALVAVADGFLDFTGPATAAQIEIIDNHARQVYQEIKAIDPSWHFDELGPNTSVQGRLNRLDDLRWHRAAVALRRRSDLHFLQVETLRFMQARTDIAYEYGTQYLRRGRIKLRLSEREALGNYIDARVRRELRLRYAHFGINAEGKGPVRVNRRENITSGSELTYRRPDARVGRVAYDVTLTRKLPTTAQVRGFFQTDFQPTHVVIVRPQQEGDNATYVITRPEVKR